MTEPKAIAEFESVRTWLRGLREQWGEEPEDWDDRVAALASFCAFVEKDPDAVIAECVRESDSGKRISLKGRRYYSERIAEWQAGQAGDRLARGRVGNAVRSFLIHNGIFIQAGMQA